MNRLRRNRIERSSWPPLCEFDAVPWWHEPPEDESLFELGYGHFRGGDPRRFRPDPECCYAEEFSRWLRDCLHWEVMESQGVANFPESPASRWIGLAHVTFGKYGLGTMWIFNGAEPENDEEELVAVAL